MHRCNATPADYAAFLQSMVRLNAIEKMTQNLDKQLADSQRIMFQIKDVFDSVAEAQNADAEPANVGLRHEDISKFLESDVPNLLLPDMVENTADIDLDDVIAKMKGYAENLKKNIVTTDQRPRDVNKTMQSLDLEKYAASLEQLSKRLANMNLSKKNNGERNPELESKLGQLCEDVHMFSQMVEAKTKLSESNKNWTKIEPDNNALQYDGIINKLLSGINEVTYLLQNKN